MCLAHGIVNSDLVSSNTNTKATTTHPHQRQHHHYYQQQHRNLVNDSVLMDYNEPPQIPLMTPYNHIYKRSISMVGDNPTMTGGSGTTQRRQIKILVKAR